MEKRVPHKFFLIFHGRFPGEKAAAIFAAKTAEAFVSQGRDVIVLAPRRLGRIKESPKKFFGLKSDFNTVYLPIIDLFAVPGLKRFAFLKSYATFSLSVAVYLLFYGKRTDIIYSNEPLPLLLSSFFFSRTFFEVHDFPRLNNFNKAVFSRAKGIIVTNRWKRDELIRVFNLNPAKVFYEANAVDIERFDRSGDGQDIRKKYDFGNKFVVGYSGSLRTMGMEKGVGILLEAIKKVSDSRLLIIGGSQEDMDSYKKVAQELGIGSRVVFVGRVAHHSVPEYLKACDCLVAPFPKTEHYEFYMSPMKVFEYMAAGRPVVASKLRSIEEVVESNAILVEPDSADALVEGIKKVMADRSSADHASQVAYNNVREHSWIKRASRIMGFIGKP